MDVIEDVMVMGSEEPLRRVERDERLLLAPAHPGKGGKKYWREHPELAVVHFPQEYQAQPFAPPRAVYENDQVRLEWQIMDGRQPFYHRNCDVDEISYQIDGERTLMTELGVIEHRPGEFSRIPRGVAHDNYGRKESHLLFYIPAPVTETAVSIRNSEEVSPPYPGWELAPANEAVTQCMAAIGHDITVFPADEQRLLNHVRSTSERIGVFRGDSAVGTNWLYLAEHFRLGVTVSEGNRVRHYRRTVDADEIQYQARGFRTLFTQRGIVNLGPGDFVRIPLGIAHASASAGPSEHIVLQSHLELPQIAETTRTADIYSIERLEAADKEVDR
ncbi:MULTISPECIES: hypothetical protein [unclassified Mycolicibacterium]|uniref:hypothetical protein n=1 Tax=unclassified Mycolicibacterium TaxID=2636767 RepID=UPI002EDAE9C9